MTWQVQENGKPCNWMYFPEVHDSWDGDISDSLVEAYNYARKWLGSYGKSTPDEELFAGYDYSGLGDIVRIIEL